jgi:hypothetical protein
LFRGDRQADVVAEHGGIAAVLSRVGRRPAEDLAEPDGDVMRVVVADVCEQERQERILVDVPIADLGQALDRGSTTGPLVK